MGLTNDETVGSSMNVLTDGSCTSQQFESLDSIINRTFTANLPQTFEKFDYFHNEMMSYWLVV